MKKEGMSIEQKLYPQNIYQINQTHEEFNRICKIKKDQFISFGILDCYTKKFNSLVVDRNRWSFEGKDQAIVKNIKECYIDDTYKTLWQNFFTQIERCGIEDKKESIVFFKKNIGSKAKLDIDAFHFHLLNLYQSYPLDSDENIDGVIFRNFKKFMKKKECLCYAIGKLLNENEYKNTYNDYPWIDMRFVFESGSTVNSFSSQEFAKNKDNDIEYTAENRTEKIKQIRNNCDIAKNDESGMKLYRDYIVPIIVGYPHPNHEHGEYLFNGLWYDKCEKQFLLSADKTKKLISKFKFILCIPVYDAFIDKRLYGNFYGNITFAFETVQERNDFIGESMKKGGNGAEIKRIDIIKENLFLYVK